MRGADLTGAGLTGAGLTRVAFLTGGSAGTGQAIAGMLARDGYSLVLIGRDNAALRATGEAAAVPFFIAEADLRDAGRLAGALSLGLAWSGGRADALVNAAGVTGPIGAEIGAIAVDDFDETMAVNLRAPFVTLSTLLPVMRRQKSGRAVSIGGTHGMRGRAGRAAYVASKWALRGLHRSAALEAGPDGVTVNLVMPGPIRVPRMERGWQSEADATRASFEDVLAGYTARMGGAMGRLNTPEDVAGVVRFLLGPEAANITGQEIVIDCGTIV